VEIATPSGTQGPPTNQPSTLPLAPPPAPPSAHPVPLHPSFGQPHHTAKMQR